jgi:Fic family protein
MNTDFIVAILPPNYDVENVRILKALNAASRVLGELRGEIKKIPNSQILIDTISLQEAKDSNEIENIVTTDDELYQAAIEFDNVSQAAKEAQHYAKALKLGFSIIKEKGILSINDIKKIQEIVSPNHPIRKIPGTVLKNPKTQEVVFTPPQNHNDIVDLLSNLEKYINNVDFHNVDGLIKMPIVHYQFETIHPFYDGNGRTGRILNMLFLVHQNLLDIPVLYLSSYIIKNKTDYYRLLQEVRTENNWEEWILWMLKGVELTARETIVVVNNIKNLMDDYKMKIRSNHKFYSHDLINILFKHPYTKIDFLEKELKIHRHTASVYLNALAGDENKFVTKIKIGKSNYFVNEKLLTILKNR